MMSDDKKEKVQFNYKSFIHSLSATYAKKKKDRMVSFSPFKYLRNQNEFKKLKPKLDSVNNFKTQIKLFYF